MAKSKAKDRTQKSTTIFIVVALLVVGWFVAPLFLPLYRWLHVDFKIEAQRSEVPIDELKKEFELVLFYNPRNGDERDPAAWCIMNMDPEWFTASTDAWKKDDEFDLAMRCILVSDRTGKKPSTMFIGSFPRDRYYSCTAWRLKPGALGHTGPRPVVLFKASTWTKLDRGLSFQYTEGGRSFYDVDEITDQYDDYWEPPLPPEAEPETAPAVP